MRLFHVCIAVCLSWLISSSVFGQERYTIQGRIVEKNTGVPVEFATVVSTESNVWCTSNQEGEFELKVRPGTHSISISCLGYAKTDTTITLNSDIHNFRVALNVLSLELETVIVTAQETGIGASSVIEQTALNHLQPKSIADIMQLMPGGVSENPSLDGPKQIMIREVGYLNGGSMLADNRDNTSAIGAAIILDGSPVSNDANLQVTSTARGGISSSIPSSAGKGSDLRTFTTDNIESVEVIRGVPSVQYGDLTSGAVIIKTKAGSSPLALKASMDPNTKMVSVEKGFGLDKDRGAVNVNLDYTQYYPEIRQKSTGYRRVTSNFGYSNTFFRSRKPLMFNFKFAYHGTIDNEKTDPQLTSQEIIRANTKGFRTSIYGRLLLDYALASNVSYNISVNYSHQHDYSKALQTTNGGVLPIATALEEGEHAVAYLPAEYYSELTIDGKPFNVFAQIKANAFLNIGRVSNNFLYGTEWKSDGNSGEGKTFDLNFPPYVSTGATMRPRPFKDIPSLNVFSLFIEDNLKIPLGKTMAIIQGGVRFANTQPTGLFSSDFYQSVEPRINAKYQIVNSHQNPWLQKLNIRFGMGKLSKSPSLLYLYPDPAYTDVLNFNYYDESNPDASLAVVETRIIENTSNPGLKPATNIKKEAGIDFTIKGIQASLTAYVEKQTNGFGFQRVPIYFDHREYDVGEGNGKNPYYVEGEGVYYYEGAEVLTASFDMDTNFYFYNKPVNDYVLIKKGIEYTLDLGEINRIQTSFVVDGAYMYTRSYNTRESLLSINRIYQGNPFPYIVLYPAGEQTIRQRLITNIRAITHIPSVRMVISLTSQIVWFDSKQYKYEDEDGNTYVYATENNVILDVENIYDYTGENVKKIVDPVGYFDKAGNYYIWNSDNRLVPPYYTMLDNEDDKHYLEERFPPVVQFNVKLTKEVSDNLNVSLTANNFTNFRPLHKYDRESGYIKRNAPIYFGAELKFIF